MIVEMLLNNDIPKKIGQMILHFKRKNVTLYIIGKSLKINFNYFIWTKCQQNMKYEIWCFYNVENKYWTNRMHCNVCSQQVN